LRGPSGDDAIANPTTRPTAIQEIMAILKREEEKQATAKSYLDTYADECDQPFRWTDDRDR
jgi:hypothetical protein